MNRTSLRGVSVIVAYRESSPERLENLLATINFLKKTYDDFELIILEGDKRPLFKFHENYSENTRYFFFEDQGPFNKSRLLNQGAKFSRSEVICFHDADMIGWPHLMRHAVDVLLDSDTSDVRTPHWSILNVSGHLKRRFCQTLDFSCLKTIDPDNPPRDVNVLYKNQSSGITFWKKDRFFAVGGYNESFVAWGGEDEELLIRATRLGLRWHSVPPPTFHLHHDALDRVGHVAISDRDDVKNAMLARSKSGQIDELTQYANELRQTNFG